MEGSIGANFSKAVEMDVVILRAGTASHVLRRILWQTKKPVIKNGMEKKREDPNPKRSARRMESGF
jgi:aromatic ring-opening dioxygenase catalytic subunit (LigB family)